MYPLESRPFRRGGNITPAAPRVSEWRTNGPTVVIMPFTDEEEIRAWDEYAATKAKAA